MRPAAPEDADEVGRVQAQVFIDTYAARLPPETVAAFDPRAFAQGWRAALSRPAEGVNQLLVALDENDRIVGLAAVGPSQDPDTGQSTGEVTLVAVHPLARRRGHGSRLLNAVVEVLRDAGADLVTAWLPADAEQERAFLLAAGFAPDGAYRDRVVSADGAVMREVRVDAALTEPSPSVGAGGIGAGGIGAGGIGAGGIEAGGIEAGGIEAGGIEAGGIEAGGGGG
ncbi:MAG: GNAT family N-acetyltransferase [Tetrasphaera sp.]|nr:GNAT family N-acetyltransferase [Tetrasphaera sp.]